MKKYKLRKWAKTIEKCWIQMGREVKTKTPSDGKEKMSVRPLKVFDPSIATVPT